MPETTNNTDTSRLEKVLSYLAASLAGISFVALLALLVAPMLGVDFGTNTLMWGIIAAVPNYGFPLAFLLIVAIIILSVVRNRRARLQ